MRRLGLDIGTNSIGWCLIEWDGADGWRILGLGSRIFGTSPQGAGRDPKSGASLAVDRRDARAMRRRRDRYLGRRSAFLDKLIHFGLMPADSDEAKLIAARDPYDIRARALTERLDPYEIGRALFHLNQRRGFKSNRKAERRQKDNEDGKIATGEKALDQAMAEADAETLGQFLATRSEKRVRLDSEAQEYDFYPQRRHVDYEFGRIWEEQAKHHPALLTEEARTELHRILFFQRPLKPVKVGVCLFAGRYGIARDEPRLAKAHPLFQERRLYEEVNHLRITSAGERERPLKREQRDTLVMALRKNQKLSFARLGKLLKLQPGESFNKATETRTDLAGDVVHAMLASDKRFGRAWEHMTGDARWEVVERLLEEEDPEALRGWLMSEHGLDEEHADTTARTLLPDGYGRLGETATRRILEQLKADVIDYSDAVKLCGWNHSDDPTRKVFGRLPYYGELLSRDIPPGSFDRADEDKPELFWGKITNPTVHIGLRQLQQVVNAVIDRFGHPDEIVVELARELNLNEKDKKAHEKRIREDTAAAIARGKKLAGEGVPDTGANRKLLKLWEELNPHNVVDRRCPYCGEQIGFGQLFNGETQVDHIIPYSLSLDDSASNKVIAHRRCNQAKGRMTPYEKWGGDPERWDTIAAQVERLHRSKQWRFGPDAMARVEKDGGFVARQLTDTQYLSRMAGKYLTALYDKEDGKRHVYVVPGRMTAMLRRLWGLNSLLPDHNHVENEHSSAPKNRLDHRHHAIDAAVMAVTSPALLTQIARAAGQAEDRDLDKLFVELKYPGTWEGFRGDLYDAVNVVVASHKPDHGRTAPPSRHRDETAGRLHNDTAYGLTGKVAADGRTPFVVHRVPLLGLKPDDIAKPGRIADEPLRLALEAATRGLAGKDFERALVGIGKHGVPGSDGKTLFQGLRRIRIREPLNVIPVRDASGRAYKAYKGDSNARFDIWRLPNGRWVSVIVSMYDAHQREGPDCRPHPAAKRIMTLRQNDLLATERAGDPLLRVVKFSGNGQIALAAANEAGALKARDATPNDKDPFKYVLSSASGLKAMGARPIRLDPLGRRAFDLGPRG